MNTASVDALTRAKSPFRDLPRIEKVVNGKPVTFYLTDVDTGNHKDAYIEDIVDSRGYSVIQGNPNEFESEMFNMLHESQAFNEKVTEMFFADAEAQNVDFQLNNNHAA